jgi:hypothetical protein
MCVRVVMLLCHNRELFRQSRDETMTSLFRVSCYDITRMCGAGFRLNVGWFGYTVIVLLLLLFSTESNMSFSVNFCLPFV